MSSIVNRVMISAGLFSVMLSLSPVIATAGTCSELIGELNAYTQGVNTVNFVMVMNTADMRWAQYTTGSLHATERSHGTRLLPPGLTGQGKQYFSDRTWSYGSVGTFGFPEKQGPFDPSRTDEVQIHIEGSLIRPGGSNNDHVWFTALSWGNAKSSSVPECKNGLMYGSVEGYVEGQGMYVISFQKQKNP